MPKYRALEKGFFGGKSYGPNTKRPILFIDKHLKPVPSWLELMKDETPAQKKAREAKEAKQKKDDAEKVEQDKIDIDAVSFTEAPKSNVETL